MKASEFMIVEAKKGRRDTRHNVKPRNPVAKNLGITASGAGSHKDKKRDSKMGVEKHKGKSLSEQLTKGQIQDKIDHNKKLIGAARSMKNLSIIPDLENIIKKLESQLKTAPNEIEPTNTQDSTPISKGYKYDPYYEEEPDGDNVKIFHYITLPNGKRVDVDFTPYQEMTGKDIDLWVKLGMPQRQDRGPLDSKKLELMAKNQSVGEADRNEMDTPEFQRALASLKKSAAQGPKKTVYDPKTGKYKVVPVNAQGNKNG